MKLDRRHIGELYSGIRQQLQRMLSKGFFHLFGANLLNQFIGFASQFAVAWILLPIDIGRIRILQSYVGVAAQAAKAGADASILKLCSESRSQAEKIALLKLGIHLVLIAASVTVAALFVLNVFGLLSSDQTLRSYFFIFIPVILTMSMTDTLMAYIQALKEIRLMARINTYVKVLTLALILGLTYWLGTVGYLAAVMGGSLMIALWLGQHIRQQSRSVEGPRVTGDHVLLRSYATYSLAANILSQVSTYLDLFVLNYLVADRTAVGYYGFALTVLIPFQTVITTAQQIATPYISEQSHNPREWYRVFWKFNMPFIAVSIGLALIGAVLLPPTLHLVFSGKYDPATPYLLICLLGWLIRTLYVLQGIGIWGLGKIKLNFLVNLLVFPLNLILIIVLIQHYGVLGAAYGNVATQIVLMIAFTSTFYFVVRSQRARL